MISLTTGNSLKGKAGTATAITYTLFGDVVTTSDSFQTLGQGQLPSSTGDLLTTTPVPSSTQYLIKRISLTNTTGSNVTGVTFYVNGTAAANQIWVGSIPANGSASYDEDGWHVYDSNGVLQYVGSTGPSSTISVGTVTNVGSSGPPTVSNVGTPTAAVFNFGLQQGATGSTGAPGVVQTVTAGDSTLVAGGTSTDPTLKRAALTGDITASTGSNATVLKNTGPGATGPIGSATAVPTVTIDAQGRTTALTSTSIQIAESQVTNLTTDLAAKAPLASPTFTGTAKTALLEPKDIEGEVWIDPSNSQGWSGSDVGAWINSAYSYITTNWYNSGNQTGGGKIRIAPGSYTQTTAAVCNTAGLSIIIEGAGDGWGATVLTWSPVSGTQLSLGGGGSNSGGVQLRNVTLTGGGSINTGSTAVSLTGAYGSFDNVAITRMGTAVLWPTASTYGFTFVNCKIQFCTTGWIPLGENNVWIGGLTGNCGTGMSYAGSAEGQLFGMAFDDNTTTAISVTNNNSRISLDGCRFENAGNGTNTYITQTTGSVSMVSGAFQNDLTSGTASTGFVQQTGGVGKYDGIWHGFGGAQVFTQVYNASSPASLTVINPIVAPGSNATTLNALNWVATGYDVALTSATPTSGTAQTVIKMKTVALNTMDQGTTFRFEAFGTQSTTAGNLTFQVHVGTAGSTADATVTTTAAMPTPASAGTIAKGLVTVRTTGSAGTCIGEIFAVGSTTAALGSNVSRTTATSTVDTTKTNFVTLSVAASAGTHTAQVCTIELLQPN